MKRLSFTDFFILERNLDFPRVPFGTGMGRVLIAHV